jgi:hypothetical protein
MSTTTVFFFGSLAFKIWYEHEKKKSMGDLLHKIDKKGFERFKFENKRLERYLKQI